MIKYQLRLFKNKLERLILNDILNPVQLAILYSNKDPQKKGTQQGLQERLIENGNNIAQSTISNWVKNGYVTNKYASAVSKISGISVEELTKNNPFRKA